ncbi:MAG: alpha/beta hydrolase fold domain-containing protein, partial [Pseudomonadota bacterium]
MDRPIGPDISVEKHREAFATLGRRLNKKIKGQVEITPIRAGQAQAEWIEIPDAMPHRVLLYLHGGGYVLGSAETYRSLVVRLCQAAQARALVVDYRLAPEHRFPAALEDTVDCYRWLRKQGVDPRGRAIVGGGSGGGLAMSTCMGLQVAEAQQPAALVALSPWTDLALTSWSIFTRAETDPMYPFETLAVFARLYLNGRSPAEPMASPFYGDFRGLPQWTSMGG